jgi:predicted N-formylglutamate amidohydrolase
MRGRSEHVSTSAAAPLDKPPCRLLAEDEPAPVTVRNENGRSPFLIVVDHASNRLPRALDGLGVSKADCARHIGWDIGIAAVSRLLAEAIDATLIEQNYSRLVIDCNRAPGLESSIPPVSELTAIPGNIGLSEEHKEARRREIFQPYHDRIAAELDRRREAALPAALVAMHSFTPVFMGESRAWHAGVLYNRDSRLAGVLLALMRGEEGLIVGDNAPYSVSDLTDYTIPVHGEGRGLPHVEIEIRQDLIEDETGQRAWAARFAQWLTQAYRRLEPPA